MLIALVSVTLAVAVIGVVLFGLLLTSIRREDHGPELACRPPTLVTALARRLCGLHVRRPVTPGPADARLGAFLASRGTSARSRNAA